MNQESFLNETHQIIYKTYMNRLSANITLFFVRLLEIKYNNKKPVIIRGLLANLLFKEDEVKISTNISYTLNEFMNTISYAFVYTDIVDDQYIGDSLAPVLRVVSLKTNSQSDMITFFDNPHYVPVKKSIINTINIRIYDTQGNPMKFSDIISYVIVKLHFKKI